MERFLIFMVYDFDFKRFIQKKNTCTNTMEFANNNMIPAVQLYSEYHDTKQCLWLFSIACTVDLFAYHNTTPPRRC